MLYVHCPPIFNSLEQPRSAIVTAGGQIFRPAAQGGIRRYTALDLALMSISAPVSCWIIETHRQED
jgi:hypothetical protein